MYINSGNNDTQNKHMMTRRLFLVMGGQLAVFVVLGARIYQLQVKDSERYSRLAFENRLSLRFISPQRGRIFDRNQKLLAVNRQNYQVAIIAEQTQDLEESLRRVGALIEVPERTKRRLMKEIRNASVFDPVLIKENLDWKSFALINFHSAALPGIVPQVGMTRYYPRRNSCVHVVGYVGSANTKEKKLLVSQSPTLARLSDILIGKNGIERVFDQQLRGTPGARRLEVNASGRIIRELERYEGSQGGDITLTIDADLQDMVMERIKGHSAAVVVMDIHNGDILSMSSSPAYDPNKFVLRISHKDWEQLTNDKMVPLLNKAVAGVYPPGSVFKIITSLVALEAGIINSNTRFYCSGRFPLGSHTFHCWKQAGHGWMDVHDALKHSCDVFFYETAKMVGIDKIKDMSVEFGVGQEVNINFPNVKNGLMPSPEWKRRHLNEQWLIGETIITGIGQGYILMNPLQLAVLMARVANGGIKVDPRIIHSIKGTSLTSKKFDKINISAENMKILHNALFSVVNDQGGTAFALADTAPAFAGKTGTAQVRNISSRERASGVIDNDDLPWEYRDHALFTAFGPFDNPRYAIAVVVEHGGSGSKVAAPIARDVYKKVMELYPVANSDIGYMKTAL